MNDKTLKVIPIGGQEQVGLTMLAIQYADDILILDLGFEFPEENMHGVDYVIPNTEYLRANKEKIRGVIISHVNFDHFGGTPYLIEGLGYPTIYTGEITKRFIEHYVEEFGLLDKIKIQAITSTTTGLALGCFSVDFFHVNHNVPDAMGVAIHTPVGLVVHTGDFKFDNTPVYEQPTDYGRIAAFGNQGVLLACTDSTNALVPGYSVSEASVAVQLEHLIRAAKGRVLVSTFSTLIYRIQLIIELAQQFSRKVVILGKSMVSSIEICRELGYIRGPDNLFIALSEADKLPDDQVLIISTGAQATQYSALELAARNEHKQLKIREGDTVILSSSVVPGNEKAVERLLQGLVRQGAKTFQHAIMGIHSGGHAKQEEIKLMLNLLRPKFFMPVMGMQHMLATAAGLAQDVGIPASNIIMTQNGDVVSLTPDSAQVTDHIHSSPIYVYGKGSNVSKTTLREREQLANDGLVIVLVLCDKETGEMVADPQINTRGVAFGEDSQAFLAELRRQVKTGFTTDPDMLLDSEEARNKVRADVQSMFVKSNRQRPMVMVWVVEVETYKNSI
jgi:ribonuclease J